MCGIAGIVDFKNAPPDPSLLRRMLGLIAHRGPDAFGIYSDEHCGLAHARLSIIDLAGGDQPIHNEDRTLWIVYNGEVFNYPDLRAELIARGHHFYTNTDTEILVHLYEEKGPQLFSDLNGQFAVALWDSRKRELLLGRDRLGVRPLFYHLEGSRLTFGSEVKAIFADELIPRSLDIQTLSDVFTCWAPFGASTPFEGVHQLPAGHCAVFSSQGLEVQRYWQIPFGGSAPAHRDLDDAVEELSALLLDAVRIRLRADVPVGAYLSGGLDSTTITALVKRHFNNQLRTFSVSFTDGRFDEAPFQQRAVEALHTEHQSIRCTEHHIGECFPEVIWHAEVPTLRTAPAPLFRLSRLVRENNFKVVLTGEGSDELFAGYDIFKEDRVRRFWARRPDSTARPRLLGRLYPDIFNGAEGSRTGAFLMNFFRKGLNHVDSPVYSHQIRWDNTSQLKSFFSPAVRELLNGRPSLEERHIAALPPDFMRWDPLSRAQYTEISIFLSNYLLSTQGDRMAMAHAVEGRYPFLDHRVVDLACSLPPLHRMHGLRDKFILRKSADGLIPAELSRRPKQPYRAPISTCFLQNGAGDYVEHLLSTSAITDAGIFDPHRVRALMEKCERQDGRLTSERENMALVGILSTQLLHEQFIRRFPHKPVKDLHNLKVYPQ
jgi:asparagine synthase (glutamine-hydrolysing)